VRDKDVVIVDEMIDTGVTLVTLSEKVKAAGAKTVTVCASHGLFTNNAMTLINDSAAVDRVLVTDTLPLPKNASGKVEQFSVAKLLARVIETEHCRAGDAPDELYEIQ
jgi:ribose-phosphate pyrophosphokinase